jgi:hypothetical protein
VRNSRIASESVVCTLLSALARLFAACQNSGYGPSISGVPKLQEITCPGFPRSPAGESVPSRRFNQPSDGVVTVWLLLTVCPKPGALHSGSLFRTPQHLSSVPSPWSVRGEVANPSHWAASSAQATRTRAFSLRRLGGPPNTAVRTDRCSEAPALGIDSLSQRLEAAPTLTLRAPCRCLK